MTHHADIKGLPLILGGEIRAVAKLAERAESAVILVRGPAGSGKTIFATQLAAHEALVRGGDVAYCCIELLPSELDAQISGLTFGPEARVLRVSNVADLPPGTEQAPRIYASIVEVPELGVPDIGAELQRVIDEAARESFTPKVVVIDSLAEGYRLGASVPRYLADALAKFAADNGILLVLLEEVMDQRDSTWTFIADVVLELAHHGSVGTSAAEERSLTVRKNRFGPAHVGPHAFAIHRTGGIVIYPRLSAYLSEFARSVLPQQVREQPLPHLRIKENGGGYLAIPEQDEVVLLTGNDATTVLVALDRMVQQAQNLYLDMASMGASEERVLRCGDPLLGPERLLSELSGKLESLSGSISGLVVGDLGAIDRNIDPDGMRRALPVILMIARSLELPVLLYETAAQHPLSVHLADTVIDVRVDHKRNGQREIAGALSSRRRGLFRLNVEIRQ
jgi:KaiC/GvpD/RAD55 family RecA-like ATPase